MKTFNCWLIANIEYFIAICILSALSLDIQLLPISISEQSWYYDFVVISALIITCLVSIFIAIYTWMNFDEVVSRQMLWRSSNVMLFNSQILYTWSRFMASFVAVVFIWLFIL